jgi:hypothetical protein
MIGTLIAGTVVSSRAGSMQRLHSLIMKTAPAICLRSSLRPGDPGSPGQVQAEPSRELHFPSHVEVQAVQGQGAARSWSTWSCLVSVSSRFVSFRLGSVSLRRVVSCMIVTAMRRTVLRCARNSIQVYVFQ